MMKLSFIGAGNMGKAMLGGVIKSGVVSPSDIMISDLYKPSLDAVKSEFGVNTTTDSKEAVRFGDVVIFAVKPNIIGKVMESVKDVVTVEKIVVSIAAAVSIDVMESIIGDDKKIIRVMPNTPALVGEAMSALCKNTNVDDESLNQVLSIFNSFGEAEVVTESLMDAVVGVSGSGPAYVFMFIEAMADAAVLSGMPRAQAYKFAAQTVLGAAKMVMDTGKHPGELKDMVCSPGGTTIEAVATLEEFGMRNSVIKGVLSCIDKSVRMSNK
ncbi:pyrroline-5-carboxylate reductase [Peptostreptococcus anaerobius]|uniref:Pyrroline-5-carboxylate reductase n=1 Tax=Peptostreptococcus porci TaxID=2652282 RepID=A0A6N7WXK4_9FIRM|nr:pyrroline-5-carboxylate reductase [Peptostreptococcus porci]